MVSAAAKAASSACSSRHKQHIRTHQLSGTLGDHQIERDGLHSWPGHACHCTSPAYAFLALLTRHSSAIVHLAAILCCCCVQTAQLRGSRGGEACLQDGCG
jgi:hypothetical protein